RRYDILFMQSLACKRIGRFDEAVNIWVDIAGNPNSQKFMALIELAKYYEHRKKDCFTAMKYTQEAQTVCPARRYDKDDLVKRKTRLEKKLSK
ncbi:MAG: hypothetical protein GY865_00235, partial [candidate division Zixibacteria bacterium]|nr:hypothetical protein [candidate division Zixibacteria bacterium]